MNAVAGLVDDLKAYKALLWDSPSADDRNVAEELERIIDKYEVPALTALDANMGPATHRPGHNTERTAALLAMPRAGTLREKVIESLWRSQDKDAFDRGVLLGPGPADLVMDGMTQEEVARYTGVYLYSIAPRFAELQRMGWIKDSGRTRATSSGSAAIVWVLTDDALRKWSGR